MTDRYNWHSRFTIYIGCFYILLGTIDFWEQGTSKATYFAPIVTLIWGIIYIILGILIYKRVVSVLLLLMPIVARTVIFDIFIPLNLDDTLPSFLGIVFALVWIMFIIQIFHDGNK